MMTDDERREAARRLRGLITDDSVYATVDAGYVLHAIGLYYKDVDRIYFSGYDVVRLADLIEPSEPKVKCVAEVKFDGERLEQPAYDAAVELTGIDRDALLALADEMEGGFLLFGSTKSARRVFDFLSDKLGEYARRIREACGEGAE